MAVMHATTPSATAPKSLHHSRAFALLTLALLVYVSWEAFTPHPGGLSGPHIDKLLHFGAFSALAVSLALGLVPSRRSLWLATASLLAYGALIEVVQAFIPGREASVLDWLADAAGIAAGLGLVAGLRWLTLPARRR
jgi:VanZ family protein